MLVQYGELWYYGSILAYLVYSTNIDAVCQIIRRINPFDSRCGIVETCRKAFAVLLGVGKSIREESVCLELRKYVNCNPEEHQEDLPLHG